MQKEVKDFFKQLQTDSDLERRFKAVSDQKEFGKVIAPYIKGCDPKKFVEELVEVWDVINGKKSNKINQKDLTAVSGGKALTMDSVKNGMNKFLAGFKGAIQIGKQVVKEGNDFYRYVKGLL
ncbi:MAG: Nif11-like leader peptide family natural product precursor [Oscillospiraceae bacterium]|jgi:hypothetical protein|nr:Nif11-like leader peptide family natural product precursor [Oscillospiraceae bacterium]